MLLGQVSILDLPFDRDQLFQYIYNDAATRKSLLSSCYRALRGWTSFYDSAEDVLQSCLTEIWPKLEQGNFTTNRDGLHYIRKSVSYRSKNHATQFESVSVGTSQIAQARYKGKSVRNEMWPIYARVLSETIGAKLKSEEATQLTTLLSKL